MKRIARALIATVLFGMAPGFAGAQSPDPPASPQPAPTLPPALAAIAAFAPRAMTEQGAPGLSIAITDRTHVLRTLTLGYANVDAKVPVTAQTRFPIGSITKSMTALSLMQLADAGRLDLDAPVSRYLPDFRIASPSVIRVHRLLSHTAGTPDDYSVSYGYADAIYNLRDAHVLFAPGHGFSYSNDGFATAGGVLAAIDGRTWSDSVRRRVFETLGMSHSSTSFTPLAFGDTAVGYTLRDADRPPANDPALVPSPPFDFVDPAGSVISTPDDMSAYMRFYLNGGVTDSGKRLISKAAFARMTSPDDMSGKPAGSATPVLAEAPALYRRYGFGLSISSDGGDKIVAHTGGISGYSACMEMNLTRGFGVVAMSNLVEAPLHPCAIVLYAMRALRAQALGQAIPAPPAPIDRATVPHAARFAGTYRAAGGATLSVTAAGSGARLVDGGSTFALFARGDDLFWTDDPRFARFLVLFHRNKAHAITDLSIGERDYVKPGAHVPSTPVPAAYAPLLGRYENDEFMQLSVTRVIWVRGRLTFDGLSPLVPAPGGSFRSGPDVVRFDHRFAGHAQRLTVDDIGMQRIDLP